jgi:hypothetical protein
LPVEKWVLAGELWKFEDLLERRYSIFSGLCGEVLASRVSKEGTRNNMLW